MIVQIVAGALGAIIAAFVWYLWQTKFQDRVSIHRVQSIKDSATDGLLNLYTELFADDGTNYSPEEILEMMDAIPSKRHTKVENIVLVSKLRGEVVGFVSCHFYAERKKAIVSYLGIDKDKPQARLFASQKLLKRLKRILLDRPCNFLFYDIQGVDPSLQPKERFERKARVALFKKSTKTLGLTAYELQFGYHCPKVSVAEDTREYPFVFMCIPFHRQLPSQVPKKTVLEFLNFVYMDCYGDNYRVTDARFQQYRSYLRQAIKYYEDSLPDSITAVSESHPVAQK